MVEILESKSVLFAGILFNPTGKIYMMFIPVGIPGFLWGALYLVYSQYMSRRRLDNAAIPFRPVERRTGSGRCAAWFTR